jgi:hypothetical protein
MPETKQRDFVTPLAIVGGGLALGLGAYMMFKKKESQAPQNLGIDRYTNLNTGEVVEYPGLIDIQDGEKLKVDFSFTYKGPALSGGKYHGAFWQSNHDELSSVEVPFTLPDCPSDTLINGSVTLTDETMTAGLYGLYVKILGIPGSDIHYWGSFVVKVPGEEGEEFDLTTPVANPASAEEGEVALTCQVKSNRTDTLTSVVRMQVYQGAVVGTGDLLDQQQQTITFAPGETKQVVFTHQSEDRGGNGDRDVAVDVLISGVVRAHGSWPDVFEVLPGAPPTLYEFAVTSVTASPLSAPPGQVTITANIKETQGSATTALVTCVVLEHGTGELCDTIEKSVTFQPGVATNVTFLHDSFSTPYPYRDVNIEIRVGGVLAKSEQWQGVFEVTSVGQYWFGVVIINAESKLPGAKWWFVYYNEPDGEVKYVGWRLISEQTDFVNVDPNGQLRIVLQDAAGNQLQLPDSAPLLTSHLYEYDAATGNMRGLD